MTSSTSSPPGLALHLAWAAFQRRQASMAPLVGLECLFLPLGYKGRSHARRLLAYLNVAWRTWRVLWDRRPHEVWVQLPQVPLLWVAMLYRALAPHPVRLVADCHNAMFRPPWSRLPLALRSLASCALVVVHNDEVRQQALALGLPERLLCVLEDVPPLREAGLRAPAVPALLAGRPRPWVLFPGSFGSDEPLAEVFEAARQLRGQATVVVTGRLTNAAKNGHSLQHLPDNVVLTDYLPLADFDALLVHCDVVLALTRFDGIQLSVCNEALGFGRAMVMSATPLLQRLFGSAAVAVDSSDPTALVRGIDAATSRRHELEQQASALARLRREDWLRGPWQRCRDLLDGRAGAPATQVCR
jgi:glycosyltransferase involved in cell wall biosynthesis